jgi:hypothetical protein
LEVDLQCPKQLAFYNLGLEPGELVRH